MVKYTVEINPKKLELKVSIHLKGDVAKGEIRLEIPSWVPGDYSFKSYARDIFDITAQNIDSTTYLKVTRDGYNAFIIENCGGNVVVSYTANAYATEFGEATGILDSHYAVLLGTRYLHSAKYLGPCQVEYINVPDGWGIHHPSGAKQVKNTHAWDYPSYEVLLDTPVSFGHFTLLERKVNGVNFYFVFVDKGVGFENKVDDFVNQIAKVAEQMGNIFGSFPFTDYTFILSLNPAAEWGLEHLTSTMCGLGPDVFVDEDQYKIGVRVCAHELFHAWNVRRLRPEPLNHLEHQLSSGSFSEGLWMAEGFTRYYEFLITARVNTYSSDEFFSAIMGYYQHLSILPAYNRVSAIDSSLATYLNHSKYSGRVNNSIDYYDKGMLIAFEIDVILRTQTHDYTLDKAFDEFYHKYVKSDDLYAGYSMQNVIDFFNKIHKKLGDRIDQLISFPGQLETLKQFNSLGFKVIEDKVYYLGLVFLNNSEPSLYNVLDDSPAGKSGLAADDVITHINGFGYSNSALKWATSQKHEVTLTVQRGQRSLNFTITPIKRHSVEYLCWKGNSHQKQAIAKWLHKPKFAPLDGQKIQLSFYENFHGLEVVM